MPKTDAYPDNLKGCLEQQKNDAPRKSINKKEFKTVQYFLSSFSKYFVADKKGVCQKQENEQVTQQIVNDQEEKLDFNV